MKFYDLNVTRPEKSEELQAMLDVLVNLGYEAVAVTTELSDEYFSPPEGTKKSKKKQNPEDLIPEPVNVSKYKKPGLVIYNRVNITVNDAKTFYLVSKCKKIKKYDLLSIMPGNINVLKALPAIDFDIFCFNPAIDNPILNFNRKLYYQFVKSGVYFELPYAPAIVDATCRKYTFYRASIYHAVGKSENIIVTSAGTMPPVFRSPYDVINLSFLFGLNEEQAKSSITTNCANLILKARTRRRGRSVIEITTKSLEEVSSNPKDDTMITTD